MFKYRVRIRPPQGHSQGDLPGLFDMLRYDAAQVDDWSHVTEAYSHVGEHYVLSLRSQRRPTTDRWNSFNLVVTDITGSSGRPERDSS